MPTAFQAIEAVEELDMAATVTICNRQKKRKINLIKWSKATRLLLAEVCKNLGKKTPPHLSIKDVRAIADIGSISLLLVSDRKIRQLNKTWRGKDYATDVLSFPMVFDGAEKCLAPALDPDVLELGEIVISIDKAENQAREYGHSFEREMAFLFVHGLLHVLGFDHQTKREEKEMFQRQTDVLTETGFFR